jgi:HTH-type transcriptional regulator/antitoxin HipB
MFNLAYYGRMQYRIQTPQQLAVHLQALRQAQGLSQAQLARKLSLSQSRVARIEKDPLSVRVGQLLAVLSALDASLLVEPTGTVDSHMPTRDSAGW